MSRGEVTTIELPPLPVGDRFKDETQFRYLGTGSGKALYECWEDAINAYARLAIEQDREKQRARSVPGEDELMRLVDEYGHTRFTVGAQQARHGVVLDEDIQLSAEAFAAITLAIRQALRQPAVPEGWKLAPKEATREMMQAAEDYYTETEPKPKGQWWWNRLYQAYLAAAPTPEVK